VKIVEHGLVETLAIMDQIGLIKEEKQEKEIITHAKTVVLLKKDMEENFLFIIKFLLGILWETGREQLIFQI